LDNVRAERSSGVESIIFSVSRPGVENVNLLLFGNVIVWMVASRRDLAAVCRLVDSVAVIVLERGERG
jgi:hypothetical protein